MLQKQVFHAGRFMLKLVHLDCLDSGGFQSVSRAVRRIDLVAKCLKAAGNRDDLPAYPHPLR